jgi:hypothetical protein
MTTIAAITLDRAESEVVLEALRQPGTTIWMSEEQAATLSYLEKRLDHYLQDLEARKK